MTAMFNLSIFCFLYPPFLGGASETEWTLVELQQSVCPLLHIIESWSRSHSWPAHRRKKKPPQCRRTKLWMILTWLPGQLSLWLDWSWTNMHNSEMLLFIWKSASEKVGIEYSFYLPACSQAHKWKHFFFPSARGSQWKLEDLFIVPVDELGRLNYIDRTNESSGSNLDP